MTKDTYIEQLESRSRSLVEMNAQSMNMLADAYAMISNLYSQLAIEQSLREAGQQPEYKPKAKQEDPEYPRKVFMAVKAMLEDCHASEISLTGGGRMVEVRVYPQHWDALIALVPLPE